MILVKMQYFPYDFHDFRGSEGPEICKIRIGSLKNTSENASLEKTVFDDNFLAFLTNFGSHMLPQELPGVPQKRPKSSRGPLRKLPGSSREPLGSILESPGSISGPTFVVLFRFVSFFCFWHRFFADSDFHFEAKTARKSTENTPKR